MSPRTVLYNFLNTTFLIKGRGKLSKNAITIDTNKVTSSDGRPNASATKFTGMAATSDIWANGFFHSFSCWLIGPQIYTISSLNIY